MKKMLSLMPLAAALALAGCVNLAPDYERPEAPVAQAWPEGESYANSELKREELPKWQNFIQDDRLKKVIELALSNNRDLRIAALNVENARALYGVQRADLFPTVAAAASNATTHRESTDSTTHAYSADLAMASYEIDFFGRAGASNLLAVRRCAAYDAGHVGVRSNAGVVDSWRQPRAARPTERNACQPRGKLPFGGRKLQIWCCEPPRL